MCDRKVSSAGTHAPLGSLRLVRDRKLGEAGVRLAVQIARPVRVLLLRIALACAIASRIRQVNLSMSPNCNSRGLVPAEF